VAVRARRVGIIVMDELSSSSSLSSSSAQCSGFSRKKIKEIKNKRRPGCTGPVAYKVAIRDTHIVLLYTFSYQADGQGCRYIALKYLLSPRAS
jgi:hypothetical protein